MSDPLAVLWYALEHAPSAVHLVEIQRLVKGRPRIVRRPLPGGGREEVGVVALEVPAMVARALRKPEDERDWMLLIHLRREALDEIVERMESRIVLPAEVGM